MRTDRARAGDPFGVARLRRAWSAAGRKLPSPADDQRPENVALRALYPDQSVEDTVFQVFVDLVVRRARTLMTRTPRLRSRTRREDPPVRLGRPRSHRPAGRARNELLTGDAAASSDDPMLSTLAACAREPRVVPLTGRASCRATSLRTSSDKRAIRPGGARCRRSRRRFARAGPGSATASPRTSAGPHDIKRAGWFCKPPALRDELAGRLEGRRTHRVGQSEGVDFDINRNRLKDWGAAPGGAIC